MIPRPPYTVAAGAGAGAVGAAFGAAEAMPGPASAASAAITAMITAPRLPEAFLAISPSLSLSAFAHEPQLLGGLCERSGRGASPIRGSGPRISLVRVISRVESTPPKRGDDHFCARKRAVRHHNGGRHFHGGAPA